MNRTALLLFFLLSSHLKLWAQEPKLPALTHYKIADGLAANIVNNVVQDDKGFLWLSTINGLQRFDGNKFITFHSDPAQPSSLPTDEIVQVYEDRRKNLWVLTNDNKIGTFNKATFRYDEVPIPTWSKGNTYTQKTFLETSDGRLLLYFNYTSNLLFEFNAAAHAFIPSTYLRVPNDWKINFMVEDAATKKIFITTDSGFVVFNSKTQHVSYPGHNTGNEPLINHNASEKFLHYEYLTADGRLFFEQWPKSVVYPTIKVYDLKTAVKKDYHLKEDYNLGYHMINAILQQQSGRIWICGLPFLAEYTNGTKPFQFLKKDYDKEKELKFTRAFSMYEDRQQNMWFCTDYGLYLFDPDTQLFQTYSLTTKDRNLVEGRAQTAFQLSNGEIWMGYRDLGLNRSDKDFKPLPVPASIEPFQKKKSVWDIHEHRKTGTIWIALQGGQLIVYDTATKHATLLTPLPFEHRAITQIAEDLSGNLWFGTQGGNVVKWTYNNNALNLESGFSLITQTGIINKIVVDRSGYVWVAAFDAGVLKINPATNTIVRQISKSNTKGYNLWNNAANDIIQYNDSLLLVASGALNLININNNRVKQISTRYGLPSNTVSSLIRDAEGVLWLGTLNGLCRADLNKPSFAVYDQNDGLPNEDFNVAGAFLLHDNRLLFTSADNFVVFNPLHTVRKTLAKVWITDFKAANVPLRVDSLQGLDHVSLNYNKNAVVFEFSALNYCKQNKLEYYYKLQNFDSTWIKSNEQHQAVYNFLPPGHYRFEVKTKDIDGVFSAANTYLNVWVDPPFWKTWWFYTFLLLLALLVLYLIDRERVRRLVSLQNVRSEIASHLHMDVSTTLNNINVLSQIAKLKADKDIMRSKELIDEISDKSSNMVLNMDEILWSIDPSNDTMEKTLLRIHEYAETLETKYGAAIDIGIHEKVKELRLDMKLRHDFFILCKDALHSLVQQCGKRNILVDIDLVRSKIILKILSLEPDKNNTVPNITELKERMSKQAAALHGHLNIEADKRETSLVLSVPVK